LGECGIDIQILVGFKSAYTIYQKIELKIWGFFLKNRRLQPVAVGQMDDNLLWRHH